MKTSRIVSVLSVCLGSAVLSAIGAGTAWAGRLQPPAGPVTGTMKSLDAIEPRICINDLPGDADAVHVITEGGQYYLTGDVTGEPGKHGIDIRLAPGTTIASISLDLNGFSLVGVTGSLDGIHSQNPTAKYWWKSKQGGGKLSSVRDWGGNGIFIEGVGGFVQIGNISVTGCGGDGISITTACQEESDTIIEFNLGTASGNGGHGVRVVNPAPAGPATLAGSVFCSAKYDCLDFTTCLNGLDGLHLENIDIARLVRVTSMGNGDDGIDATGSFRDAAEGFFDIAASVFSDNIGHGANMRAGVNALGETVDNKMYWNACTACNNGGDGFHSENMVGSTFRRCVGSGNGGSGIGATSAASTADEGFFDIAFSSFNTNVAHGVSVQGPPSDPAGGVARDKVYSAGSVACGNGLDGFNCVEVSGASFTDCLGGGNGGAGYFYSYQPGQPVYGNITFEGSHAQENGSNGMHVLVGSDVDLSMRVNGGESSRNGSGGILGNGVHVEGSPGGGGGGGRVALDFDNFTAMGNLGDGLLGQAGDHTAMAIINNMRAVANTGDGIDIGPLDPAAQFFDIAVNFEDIFCAHNGASGVRTAGDALVTCRGGVLSRNAVGYVKVGPPIGGSPPSKASHFLRCIFDENTNDGLRIESANGGQVTECQANGNGGAGIRVGLDESGLVVGMQIDRCYAGNNSEGIIVEDIENIVLRSIGARNALDNMRINPLSFSGPSASSPVWTEVKPYAWP